MAIDDLVDCHRSLEATPPGTTCLLFPSWTPFSPVLRRPRNRGNFRVVAVALLGQSIAAPASLLPQVPGTSALVEEAAHADAGRHVTPIVRPGLRQAIGKRHTRRRAEGLGAQVLAHRPADDPAAPDVQHHRQEEEARPGRHVGDVRHPEFIALRAPHAKKPGL